MTRFAPWAASPHSYAGWVPNVGSHLSFSLIGSGRGPGVRHFTQSYDGRSDRLVAVLQRRETDDFLTWKWLSRLIWPDIIQHWLLIGTTQPVAAPIGVAEPRRGKKTVQHALDEQGALTGAIYMIPRPLPPDQLCQHWMLDDIHMHLGDTGERSDRELDALQSALSRLVRWRAPNAVRVEFALMRTGELRLWYADDVLAAGIKRDQLYVHARQAYFFLKDMVHHHTHHEPSSDQITPLVSVNTIEADRHRAGEEKWRRETLWSLSRAVEKLIRAGKLIDLRQAMGILAYADAFQKTLLPYLRKDGSPSEFVPNGMVHSYDYAHIKESTRVLIEQGQARRTHNTSMLIAALASSIAALSLVSSLVSAHNSKIDPLPGEIGRRGLIGLKIAEDWLDLFARIPVIAVAIVCTAVLLISMLVSDDGVRLLRRSPRKLAQLARGLSLSLARRARWQARGAHRLLLGFYGGSIIGLVYALFRAPAFVHQLVGG